MCDSMLYFVVANTTCSPSEFKCNNGLCISRTQICDTTNNCGDASDELPSLCGMIIIIVFRHYLMSGSTLFL